MDKIDSLLDTHKMALDKILNLLGPQFSHLQEGHVGAFFPASGEDDVGWDQEKPPAQPARTQLVLWKWGGGAGLARLLTHR